MRRTLLVFTTLFLLAGPADALPSAPGFRVTTLDGRAIDSNGLIGQKIIVLRFQASYCKPCVKESAALAQLAERYRDRNVEFIAIHVQDATSDVRAFVQAQKVTYAVALDPRLNLGNRFGFRGAPYTVVINWKGEMAVRRHGESVVRALPRMLEALLAQRP